MLVDENKDLLYALKRSSNRLYAFEYDEVENTLIPRSLGTQNDYVELEGITNGGYDIALDADGSAIMGFPVGRLYVSDYTSTKIRYYNTVTWEYENYIVLDHPAIGIGLDETRGYLYAGFFTGTSGQDYLMRYKIGGDPNDSETYLEKDMGAPVMDIAVDEDTGFIYLTLKRSTTNERVGVVEVYDPTNWVSTDPDTLVLWDRESDDDFSGDGPAGIAVGPTYKPENGMFIGKIDDVEDPNGCVAPGNIYHYDITYRPGPEDEPNVVITDYLPEGVNFVSADPNWGEYFPRPDHKYVWELGDVDGYDPNTWPGGDPNYYFELTVQANTHAEPIGILYNKVSAESDWSYTDADETTRIGCWGGNVIYVDKYAPGPYLGTTWQTAYLNLTDALDRAESGCGSVIHVADGTYKPGTETSDAFEIPDGVEVYGGYRGYGGADPNERDWRHYKTILSGLISDTSRNNTVVEMGDDSLLDGVTVEEGVQGIDASNTSSTVAWCTIKENIDIGTNCETGNLIIQWSEIKENGEQGIYHSGNGYSLTVENCNIHDNQRDGIRTVSSTSAILNSVIYQNGSGDTYYGINLQNPSSSPDIHNNTIVDNINEGIRFTDNSGNDVPDIVNCIVYYNGGDSQLAGLDPDTDADYCCIQDCNEIPTNSNFNDTPDFVYDFEPYGYYHIKYESPCRNVGDKSVVDEQNEKDMDNENRVLENEVDIGADEVECEDTWHENDWTADGVINMEEFAIFSAAWLSHDPNDPDITTDPNYIGEPNYVDPGAFVNWNPICDFDDDYDVDMGDLAFFCEDWLWHACWRQSYMAVYAMGGGESRMRAAPPLMSTFVAYKPRPVPEKSIIEQILDLEDCIELLEEIWLEDPYIQQEIDADDWKKFMDAVYEGLFELKTRGIETRQ